MVRDTLHTYLESFVSKSEDRIGMGRPRHERRRERDQGRAEGFKDVIPDMLGGELNKVFALDKIKNLPFKGVGPGGRKMGP